MHVVVNSQEYNKEYRKSEVLKLLKSKMDSSMSIQDRDKEKLKLLPFDRNPTTDRIILCHVIKINDKKIVESATRGISKRP